MRAKFPPDSARFRTLFGEFYLLLQSKCLVSGLDLLVLQLIGIGKKVGFFLLIAGFLLGFSVAKVGKGIVDYLRGCSSS